MWSQLVRSFTIFRLALSFLYDYWRIRWIERHYDESRRDSAVAQVYARAGARVRRAALRLQGLIVKVGQFLSARTDVLPVAFTRELTQLQDAVPAAPFHVVRPSVELELGATLEAVFDTFAEEAIAAASLGQVHKATLHGGQVVAVKLLRPGIERLARIDLSALRKVVAVMHRFTRFGKRMNLPAIYREFEAMVRQELDYRMEADSLRRFRRQFAGHPRVVVPRVFDSYVTRRLLVMEYMEGAKVTDVARFGGWGVRPQEIVEILIDAYLRQILIDGFVHADPHPGNLLVLPDGRVVFLDFGMMSDIPRTDVAAFASLVKSALGRDLDGVVAAIDELGFLQPDTDRMFLKKAVGFLLDRIGGLQLKKGPELDDFLNEFQAFLHEEPIVVQAKYMFLGRAIGIIVGVVNSLDASIDWTGILMNRALPLLGTQTERTGPAWRERLRDLVSTVFGATGVAAADLLINEFQETGLALLRTPKAFERVLQKADQGELRVRLELGEVLSRLERQERLMARLIWLLLASVAGITGIWLKYRGVQVAGDIALGTACLFLLVTLGNVVRSRRKRSHNRRRVHRSH